MRLKHSVKFGNNQAAISFAVMVVNHVFVEMGYDLVITSFNDREHGVGSLHFKDCAFDIRTKHLPSTDIKKIILQMIKDRLTADFDVLLEYLDTENEHIHLEYDPK